MLDRYAPSGGYQPFDDYRSDILEHHRAECRCQDCVRAKLDRVESELLDRTSQLAASRKECERLRQKLGHIGTILAG